MFPFRLDGVRLESTFSYLYGTEACSVGESDHTGTHSFILQANVEGFLSYDFGPTIRAKPFPCEAFGVYCNL